MSVFVLVVLFCHGYEGSKVVSVHQTLEGAKTGATKESDTLEVVWKTECDFDAVAQSEEVGGWSTYFIYEEEVKP